MILRTSRLHQGSRRVRYAPLSGGRFTRTAASRAALCAEDVEATDDASLFDDDRFLVGLCGKHAALVIAEAIDGRASTGAVCAALHAKTLVSVPQPQCGRHLVGSRLYCDQCFAIREETGVTLAKPIRVLYHVGEETIPPLTEMGIH